MSDNQERAALKAEYDAEFEPDPRKEPDSAPDISTALALLGPSPRAVIKRVEIEFGKKIHSLEDEIVEMVSRETALKETIRKTQEHNLMLAKERDEWRAKVDPEGEISKLREDLAQSNSLNDGWQKMVEEHKTRVDDLQRQIAVGEERRKALARGCDEATAALKQANERLKQTIETVGTPSWWKRMWS